MIPCNECGRMISDQAVNCPHCGCPVAPNNSHTNNKDENTVHYHDIETKPPKPSDQKWLYALLGVLGTSLVCLGIWSWKAGLFSSDEKEMVDTTKVVTQEPPSTDVEQPVQPEQQAQPTLIYANSYDGFVNIRQTPSANSAILGELVNGGAPATLISNEGKWYKVNYNGIVGYVKSEYVNIGNSAPAASAASAAKSYRNVYYVVIGSWQSLANAKAFYNQLPGYLSNGSIYKAVAKGKVVYRMVVGEYPSRSAAQQFINDTYWSGSMWIWKSDGTEQLVY